MKKLLAIILALIMALSMGLLAGCGDDDSSSGKKKSSDKDETSTVDKNDDEDDDDNDNDDDDDSNTKLDAEDVFAGTWKTEINYGALSKADKSYAADYFGNFDMPITLIYTFDDGSYTIKADENSVKKAINGIKSDYAKGFRKFLVEECNMDEADLDDYIAEMTDYDSLDEFAEAEMDNMAEFIIKDSEQEGEYAIDGDTINFDDEIVFRFSISSSKKFKFTKIVDGDEDLAATLPWTFTKK